MALAFIDDSGSGGDSQYFVLAGYVGSPGEWASFARDWQAVLDLEPKISAFKMSQAESLKGDFLGFAPVQRDERLNRFIDVILAHDLKEASVAMPHATFTEVLDPLLPEFVLSPYYWVFIGMVTALSGIYRHTGFPEEVVDFVFDQQQGMQVRAQRLYGSFRGWYPTWQLGRVAYSKDHECLPLQAADLIAWQTRRFLCSKEGTRGELKRLHQDRARWYRHVLKKKELETSARPLTDNLVNLRKEYGDERIDTFLTAISRRNEKRQKV